MYGMRPLGSVTGTSAGVMAENRPTAAASQAFAAANNAGFDGARINNQIV
jgi:hypothetical protein